MFTVQFNIDNVLRPTRKSYPDASCGMRLNTFAKNIPWNNSSDRLIGSSDKSRYIKR